MFSRFKIKSDKDIETIKQMGLSEIVIIPERSDLEINSTPEPAHRPAIKQNPEETPDVDNIWKEKQAQIEQAGQYRDKHKDIANSYKKQARKVKNIVNQMKSQPANAIHNIDDVVKDMSSTFDGQNDMITNLVNLGVGEHTEQHHAINVTMLAMMIGKAENLSKTELEQLCTGALMHDIGKVTISSSITMKKTGLTRAEEQAMQQHASSGKNLAARVRDFPDAILNILEQHHEFLDGTGYPHGLLAPDLSKIVRIVTLTNTYDNLCNPTDVSKAMTPKTAMATMYSKYNSKLDRQLVERFISTLGVYPPGTIVQLNNDNIGLVISTNPDALLKPEILIYDPSIPKEQAMIINLKDYDELSIEDVLRPGDYPSDIYEYLGIGERLGYMMEASAG